MSLNTSEEKSEEQIQMHATLRSKSRIAKVALMLSGSVPVKRTSGGILVRCSKK